MRVLLTFLLVAVLPCASVAQQPSSIHRGDRVRLISPTYMYAATFVEFGEDSVVVEPDGWDQPVRVALSTLTRLDIQDGRHWSRGAGVGAIIGATLGGVGGVLVAVFGEPDMELLDIVAITVGSGGGLGAIVGATTAAVRWKDTGVTGPGGRLTPVRRAAVQFRFASIRF